MSSVSGTWRKSKMLIKLLHFLLEKMLPMKGKRIVLFCGIKYQKPITPTAKISV
jgi:hypothetical protein